MIGNATFHPSKIEDKIYEVMEDHIVAAPDTYDRKSIPAVTAVLDKHSVTWTLGSSTWQDCCGEAVFVSWIELGHLHMVGWDVKYD